MNRLLVTFCAVALAATARAADTSADVLVWYVDTDDATEAAGRGKSFDTIKFWAVDASGNTGTAGNIGKV